MAQFMTVDELAEYLRVTKRTVYRLLKTGSIPAVKVGHKWRFDRKAIDNWLHLREDRMKARVLVVDDDQIIRVLFEEILQEQGHTVVTAGTSAEGLECVKRMDFDLVFLDLKMPEMDGAELFRQIRQVKPEVPVTIITGYPDSELMTRALAQGPFGIMMKPFGESDIIAAVANFLRITRR